MQLVGHHYESSKTYNHDAGFSCAFRQWRAEHSHCRFVHGYAIKVHIVFSAIHLDDRNWVVDFGGLKDFKAKLVAMFDHKTVVASDDPELPWFFEAHNRGIMDVQIVEDVGCEKFAELIAKLALQWVDDHGLDQRVSLRRVDVSEHQGNSASVVFDKA